METTISPKAKGGKAAAEKMTAEERKERAEAMVKAKRLKKELPRATHRGDLKFGDSSISCAVLSNGERVLVERSVALYLGRKGGGAHWKKKKNSQEPILPEFVSASYLAPYISEELNEKLLTPISYLGMDGEIYTGISASTLPEICDVWISASKDGALNEGQSVTAEKAYILFKGFAIVGITALVDEATGFQESREKDALVKILEAFVAKELQPWVKTFPIDYYKELCRLYGIPFPPKSVNKFPSFFGHVTNNAIYSRLAPELLPVLKAEARKIKAQSRLHQFLTNDVGHPKLREHLSSIVTLLKLSNTKEEFYNLVDKIHPAYGSNLSLDI